MILKNNNCGSKGKKTYNTILNVFNRYPCKNLQNIFTYSFVSEQSLYFLKICVF